ncbi:MAG: glycosyltransferase family 2 protein [Candidatus Shapirobacteria bacterium]
MNPYKPKISVIIPFYNEGPQIKNIVGELQKSELKPEIIIVNDGSLPQYSQNLQHIENITLINHPQNRGKSQALVTGLKSTQADIVVFFDGDLINLKTGHLKAMVDPIINDQVDMVIGEFLDGFKIFNYIGQTVIFSGTRSFKRQVITKHLDIFNDFGNINGYLIESKINRAFFKRYRVAKVKLPQLTQDYKWQKFGLIKGAPTDIKMMLNIYKYLGLKEYLSQLKFARSLQ